MWYSDLLIFAQVIGIDVILSGDNAIIIGALAASLPPESRNKAIFWGMVLALVMRIVLSVSVVYVLMIPGIILLGGLLLFYVAWKMYRDLRADGKLDGSSENKVYPTFRAAMIGIALSDLSMSLDNILAVVGAAGDHIPALVTGLILSVALMGFAAKIVSGLIEKHKWIAWVGLALIIFIAGRMIYHGVPQALAYFN